MKEYLKILAIFLYVAITIITCSAVWNSKPGAFISIVAVILMAVNGYIAYRYGKELEFTKKDDIPFDKE